MAKRYSLLTIVLAIFTWMAFTPGDSKPQRRTYLVVLSLDGFRWDYNQRTSTPNLDAIALNGTKAVSLIPSFPSTTFANHYTLATGLYPDHHGIILNTFYDPETDRWYNKPHERESVQDGSFYGGEPIWVTAEKQKIKAATYFWVGSEADIQHIRPTYWKKYRHRQPFEQRIDTVIHGLNLPESERPNLVMLYFHEPDESGHGYGPENDSLLPVIQYLDSLVGDLRSKLAALPIGNEINFIVVSDHGMEQLNENLQILLDQRIDTSLIELSNGWNPTMNLKAKPQMIDSLYNQLKKIEHLNVWKHEEAPEVFHHGTNPRGLDISLVADHGWSVDWSWKKGHGRGTHGYDIRDTDVHAIFYAEGPDIRKNYIKPSFSNIHVYPLMAKLLQLQPAVCDGTLDSVSDILINRHE